MKCAKPFGMAICVITLLLSSAMIVTTQISANSAKTESDKKDADKTKPRKKPAAVPEPATVVLLGAAAGVAGVRKVWQDRRRSRLVGTRRAAASHRMTTS